MTARIEKVVSPTFDQNAYILYSGPGTGAVVIDPGFNVEELLRQLHYRELTVEAILLTHGHIDHIAGVGAIKALAPDAPVVIGTRDAAMLGAPEANLSAKYGLPLTAPSADRLVEDGDILGYAGFRLAVSELPGHSPGHVVYYCGEGSVLFGGDVLFAGSIGRTDFPGGSLPQLLLGIEVKLWPLPTETAVHPGHGPATTLGAERRTNPYLRG